MNYFIYKAIYVLKHFKLFDFFKQMKDIELDNYIRPLWLEKLWCHSKGGN